MLNHHTIKTKIDDSKTELIFCFWRTGHHHTNERKNYDKKVRNKIQNIDKKEMKANGRTTINTESEHERKYLPIPNL